MADVDRCIGCGAATPTPRAVRKDLTVYHCATCGLETAKAKMVGGIIETDPGFYQEIERGFDLQVRSAHRILPTRLVRYEALLGRPVSRVLEIGCATGAYAPAFNALGCEYVGIEVVPELAERGKALTGLDIRCANLSEFPEDEHFDLVFFSQVLEHISEPLPFIDKALQHCSQGIIHMDVPNHASAFSKFRKLLHPREYGFIQPPHHMIAYNKTALCSLLLRAGADVVTCRALANDDPVWGQLVVDTSALQYWKYRAANLVGEGSLLMALCKSP